MELKNTELLVIFFSYAGTAYSRQVGFPKPRYNISGELLEVVKKIVRNAQRTFLDVCILNSSEPKTKVNLLKVCHRLCRFVTIFVVKFDIFIFFSRNIQPISTKLGPKQLWVIDKGIERCSLLSNDP